MEKMFLTPKDLQAMGLSRNKAYELFNREDAPILRIGDRKYIIAAEFQGWLAKLIQKGGE